MFIYTIYMYTHIYIYLSLYMFMFIYKYIYIYIIYLSMQSCFEKMKTHMELFFIVYTCFTSYMALRVVECPLFC